MNEARDTFLHFLADNLSAPIIVHHLRTDPDNPGAANIQTNAVNVQFIHDDLAVNQPSDFIVTVDVVHEDERTCIDWTRQVFQLLSSALYTPGFNYSSGSPVATGTNLYWSQPIRFRPIFDELYVRRGTLLTVNYKF